MSDTYTGAVAQMSHRIGGIIPVGIEGEHRARELRLLIADWLVTWPGATPQLLVQRRGDEAPYIANTRLEGAEIVWLLDRYDTAKPGKGRIWVAFVDGDALLGLTPQTVINVEGGPDGLGEDAPQTTPPWLEQALEAAQRMEAAASRPPVIGEDGSWMTWDEAAGAYVDSGLPARGPEGPQGEQGPQGPEGPAGSDASVTGQSIASALGYTPADAEDVSALSDEIANKADKAYMVTLFEDLKALILAGDTDGAVALLDQAILDSAVLA